MHQFLTGYIFLITILLNSSCNDNRPLPYLGNSTTTNGETKYHTVNDFEYLNQDSILITKSGLSDKIMIADFFFTSCPSICPIVMKQMMYIHEVFKEDDRVVLLSFTIDPKRDDIHRLKLYAQNLGVDTKYWHFLTGDKEETFELANSFFVSALEDADAPGGFDHSGKIILVDKAGHIRAFTEGTLAEDTPAFIENVKKLLREYEK